MDISKHFLKASAQALSDDYPWLDIHAACIDYTRPLELPFCPDDIRKLAFFPGSSIGNFEPKEAVEFMSHVSDAVGDDGAMLIGADLKKDKRILDKAYNDEQGVTAEFNLNLLRRINRELDADFDLDNFDHHAFYNQQRGRIEMHLVSTTDQTVNSSDEQIAFTRGETIHTENSYKYTLAEFQGMATQAGFNPVYAWTDDAGLFSVHYFEKPSA